MSIIIYLLLVVLVLILLVLFSAIGLTFKFNVLGLEERKEFKGTFTIKWLFISHTFSFKAPKAKEPVFEEPEESIQEEEVILETGDLRDKKGFEQTEYRAEDLQKSEGAVPAEQRREIGIKIPQEKEEKAVIAERAEKKEKTSPVDKIKGTDKIKGKKEVKKEDIVEPSMGMTTKEKLHWGIKAFRELRKPLLRLFSETLHGIKIKHLDSCLVFGLSDPADTGMLCGFIHAVAGFIYSRCKHCSFSINPVFMMKYMLDFQGNAEISVRIYSMTVPFVKFIFNRNTLSFTYSFIKAMFQKKWESDWGPKWKSKWGFKWKSKLKSNS